MTNQADIDEDALSEDEGVINETIQMIIGDMVISFGGDEDNDFCFYERRYYREPGIYRLPELIQPVMLDIVRKMGAVPAIKILQRAFITQGFPVKVDGIVGPITVSLGNLACKIYGRQILDQLIKENADYYARRSEKKQPHKPVTDNRITIASLRAEQAEMVKIMGSRFKEAREICNMSQILAAKELGYSNSSKLNKIEGSTDTISVPLWVIRRASRLYDVSIDFLFGETDDWERDITASRQHDVARWLVEYGKNADAARISAFLVLNNKLSALEKAVDVAVKRSGENLTVLRRVQELNPEFNELRGGSKLVLCAQESVNDANKALAELKRFHCLIDASHSPGVGLVKNVDIFGYEDDGFDY
jgi:hypothetical protein